MSDSDQALDGEPPAIDPYSVLGLEPEATAQQIRNAYRKAALKNHPDKVPDDQKAAAHTKFQAIAFAYAVLSDPARRKRYDATGSTAESIVDSEGFDWSDFYREQFKDAVSTDAIQQFAAYYKGSQEEKDDVLTAYENGQGSISYIFEHVMLSDVVHDDTRFRHIIDEAIENNDVESYAAYAKEDKKKRKARVNKAMAEAQEAEKYAKQLGVHDKLFGHGKKEKSSAKMENNLAALIQKRQQDRSASFLDHLAEKYGASDSKNKKERKRRVDKEPSEEAFQAAAARLGKAGDRSKSASKRARH
ncbi:hypothetical protein CDD82_7610 [Ophiocordyceps australis]|uniref:J domain-containing protein n=1 Tax=Ophiocordyceps australis TaxID=1399860 RepID=A0A2C5YPY8_9HYPO|nr:hypothetical protein CDD82_7610 [Ophiocordyceps australis]